MSEKNEKSKFLEGRNLQKEERKKIWRKKLTKQKNFLQAKKHKNHKHKLSNLPLVSDSIPRSYLSKSKLGFSLFIKLSLLALEEKKWKKKTGNDRWWMN